MKSQTELREEIAKAKLKYGGLGLVCGAVIAMIIGFAWGGWTTSGTTQRMTKEAVLASQAAICVAQFMKEPNHGEKLKEFEKFVGWEKVTFIEKGGWAQMPGGEKADLYACRACADGLELLIKK
jgi:predicted negative regulator of RcsB-dependent stress response